MAADPATGPPASLALDVRGEHLEGITWDARAGRLRFVDLPRGRVYSADLAAGRLDVQQLPAPVTAVHPTTDPRLLLVADGNGMALAAGDRIVGRLADPLRDRPDVRMNDGNVDPDGRYFAGSMAYAATPGAACLWRLDPDGTLTTVLTGVTVSNGIDWSPDGTRCYFVDSPQRRVDVFDYDRATAALTRRRCFADTGAIPGVPDGLTVDAEGGVWVAFFGGGRVCRFAPDGRLDHVVPVPVRQVSSCCFAGPGLTELMISTSAEGFDGAARRAEPLAGSVFRARPGWRGRPANEFALRRPGA